MTLSFDTLVCRMGGRLVLDGVSAEIPDGRVTGILGPNGAGKSTLLRLAAGLGRPDSGRVLLDGFPVDRLPRRQVARRVAYLEQNSTLEIDMTVLDAVLLGRIPHRSGFLGGFEGADDRGIALDALERVGAASLAERHWSDLSGGERQRVRIARTLAQDPELLLLDEPTNHLDVHAQQSLLASVRAFGLTSVIVLHDLNIAAAYCDHLLVVCEGRLVAAGTPWQVLTPELVEGVYGTRCTVLPHPSHGGPLVVYAMEGADSRRERRESMTADLG